MPPLENENESVEIPVVEPKDLPTKTKKPRETKKSKTSSSDQEPKVSKPKGPPIETKSQP